ncbi:energy-coupling factor ABC transporter permease [Hydrogenophaga sp.]|uniref:energy-coupling factor ABC transporter permease n=1 Tax=Hydrogenophaga sp. TaxID=1904254 RepID=UPI002623DEB3|nr:energy-coupling factor ABC transporter permease [Hydrogenophaga sp.]MCW5653064.1 energy-coupling factor ABC transporter permease [Hydrogenophaga sp.]
MALEAALSIAALALALSLRPWRMLGGPLLTPALATLALLPWLWLLPQRLPAGLPVQFSGASLLVLMLGWPLAVPVLALVALQVWLIGQTGAGDVLSQGFWLGLVPATLVLAIGAVLKRYLPPNPFVYTLGRGFLGTAAALFVSGSVMELLHHGFSGVALEQALVSRWLMAWGDAFLTGMLVAVFVAFRPQWLATWSDERYLKPPPPGA